MATDRSGIKEGGLGMCTLQGKALLTYYPETTSWQRVGASMPDFHSQLFGMEQTQPGMRIV